VTATGQAGAKDGSEAGGRPATVSGTLAVTPGSFLSWRSRGRRLSPGRYRLVGSAVDGAKNRSAIRTVTFRIARR
jgi:hypothetical protein